MKVNKKGCCADVTAADEQELALINRLARKKLTAEEVYTFTVRLCDNEVDRDGERFENETLEELARLFVGKTGIFDHQWSAAGQVARIYRAEVADEPETITAAGDPCRYVKGWAYMMRTPASEELIARLEGGILREVSVGCAVEKAVCSVCGKPAGTCEHRRGERYGDKLCYVSLQGAKDAYEWSFVAVPAQPKAGVMKQKRAQEGMTLRKLAQSEPACREELAALEREAAAGRRYLDALRGEVTRLAGLAQDGVDNGVMRSITEKLEESELLELKRVYAKQAERHFPLMTQLDHSVETAETTRPDGAFLI